MGHEALRETMDVVLWQLDPEYRRRVKQNTRQRDRSLDASRRRLRLLRRLKQTDFAPTITEREIRRIEVKFRKSRRTDRRAGTHKSDFLSWVGRCQADLSYQRPMR